MRVLYDGQHFQLGDEELHCGDRLKRLDGAVFRLEMDKKGSWMVINDQGKTVEMGEIWQRESVLLGRCDG